MEQHQSFDAALWRLLFQIVDRLRESALDQQQPHEIELAMNLTLRQQQLLRNICILTETKPEGVSLKELAASLALTSGAASAMVEMFVRRELLERRTDQQDRRAVRPGAGHRAAPPHPGAGTAIQRHDRPLSRPPSGR